MEVLRVKDWLTELLVKEEEKSAQFFVDPQYPNTAIRIRDEKFFFKYASRVKILGLGAPYHITSFDEDMIHVFICISDYSGYTYEIDTGLIAVDKRVEIDVLEYSF